VPYISYVPRINFEPTFAHEFATRQDLNVAFDKVFNFNGQFKRMPVASDSSASELLPWLQRRIAAALPQSTSRVGRCVFKHFRLVISEDREVSTHHSES
jgi:hypothetical protein